LIDTELAVGSRNSRRADLGDRAARVLTLALILGAAPPPDQAVQRLSAMSSQRRATLAANLERFDRLFTPEQQRAIRELDAELWRLPEVERSRYFAVLRRYAHWVRTLPEHLREELSGLPPSERMKRVREIAETHPPPNGRTSDWIQLAEIGGIPPFELAALYRIWQVLTPAERREVDALPAGSLRQERLLKIGRQRGLPGEIRPPDYNEAEWIAKAESRLTAIRGIDPELRRLLTKIDARLENLIAKRKQERGEVGAPIFAKRLAANLYYLDNPVEHRVTGDRLAGFLQSMPSWLRPIYDSLPADEARRRLTIVYRLVYPYPQEWRPEALPSDDQSKGGSRRPTETGSRPGRVLPSSPAPTKDTPF
jgi:hypothetical protein